MKITINQTGKIVNIKHRVVYVIVKTDDAKKALVPFENLTDKVNSKG